MMPDHNTGGHICKQCSKCFDTKKYLSKHERTVHQQVKSKKCPVCSNSEFSNNYEYGRHFEDSHKNKNSNNYVCNECGDEFRTRRSLVLHTRSKCGILSLHKCNACGKGYKTAASLHNHVLRHKGTPNFMCRFCAKLFITMGQLEIHERVHTQDKPFSCDVCGKSFRHRQSLVTHSTLHTGIKPFVCESCSRSFSCVGNLIKHRSTHAECAKVPLTSHTVKNSLTKMKLQANTPKNCRLKQVLKEKIKENVQQAQTMDASTKERTDLPLPLNTPGQSKEIYESSLEQRTEDKLHNTKSSAITNTVENILDISIEEHFVTTLDNIESEHNASGALKMLKEGDGSLKESLDDTNIDDACVKLSEPNIENGEEETLEEGVPDDRVERCTSKESKCKRGHADGEKDFQAIKECEQHPDMLTCTICDKTYSSESSLKIHKKTFHLGIPRKVYKYICPHCGKQFNRKASLVTHEKNKCDNSLKLQCEICSKTFATVYSRKAHMRVHSTKKFLCNYCGKRFHWKAQLKIHERSHTGDKPFSCLYCPKVFAYRESLITHSSIHTGIKPHLCEACGSRFSCIGNLMKHRTTHAGTCGIYHKTQPKVEANI